MKARVSFRWFPVVLAGVSFGGGCRFPLSVLGPGGRRGATHRTVDGGAPSSAAASILHKESPGRGDVRIVDVVFDVVQVDLAMDGRRYSRKIWNHVDELRVGSKAAARIARNGLRIGAASPSAWPAIRAILTAAEAEVRRNQLIAQPGSPLLIKLGTIREPESIFSYSGDGRLVGKTIPAGDKLLSLDYVFHPELGGCIDLELGFEIRHDRGVMTWERRRDIIRQVPSYNRHVFAEAAVSLTLDADGILIVGINDEAGNDYLVGSRFLIGGRSGDKRETLFLVTPRPYQTRGLSRPPT